MRKGVGICLTVLCIIFGICSEGNTQLQTQMITEAEVTEGTSEMEGTSELEDGTETEVTTEPEQLPVEVYCELGLWNQDQVLGQWSDYSAQGNEPLAAANSLRFGIVAEPESFVESIDYMLLTEPVPFEEISNERLRIYRHWQPYTAPGLLEKEGHWFIVARVTDNYGEGHFISTPKIEMIQGYKGPVTDLLTLEWEGEHRKNLYQDKGTLRIQAQLPVTEGSLNAVTQVRYELYSQDAGNMPRLLEEEVLYWGKEDEGGNSWPEAGVWHINVDQPEYEGLNLFVRVSMKDRTGQEYSLNSEMISIDMQPPELTLMTDESTLGTQKTIWGYVREANCTLEDIGYILNGQICDLEGLKEAGIAVAATPEGIETEIVMIFQTDGSYSVGLICEDLAGHITSKILPESFIVDTTAPEIEISGIAADSSNQTIDELKIYIKDAYLDNEKVNYQLKGAVNQKRYWPEDAVTITPIQGGLCLTIQSWDKYFIGDDIYTLDIVAKDLAGNESSKRMTFSLNRSGSLYYCKDRTAGFLEDYYLMTARDLEIVEVNVDPLLHQEITIVKDGEIRPLTENLHYERIQNLDIKPWTSYTYKIFGHNFTEDGVYRLILYSEDKALHKNYSNSPEKQLELTFILDQTPPVCSLSQLEEGGVYEPGPKEFVINVEDNMVMAQVQVYVDGRLYCDFDREIITENQGTLKVELELLQDSENTIEVRARDMAGNWTVLPKTRIQTFKTPENEALKIENKTPQTNLKPNIATEKNEENPKSALSETLIQSKSETSRETYSGLWILMGLLLLTILGYAFLQLVRK